MNKNEQPRTDTNTDEPRWMSIYKATMGFAAFSGLMAWMFELGAAPTAAESAAFSAFAATMILVVD